MTMWHVVAILAIVLNIILLVGYLATKDYGSALVSVLFIVLCVAYLILSPVTDKVQDISQEIKSYELASEMIADGCKVYLDGQVVDPNVIRLEDYRITIKDDFVILSRQ